MGGEKLLHLGCGRPQRGQLISELIDWHSRFVSLLLVAGQGRIEQLPPAESSINCLAEQFSIMEGVGDALGRGVFVVASVAHKRPPRIVRLAEKEREVCAAVELLDPSAAAHPLGQARYTLQGLYEVTFDVCAHLSEGRVRPEHGDASLPVVGQSEDNHLTRPWVQFGARQGEITPVGVVGAGQCRLHLIGRRLDAAGHEWVHPVGADHDGRLLAHHRAGGGMAADARDALAVREHSLTVKCSRNSTPACTAASIRMVSWRARPISGDRPTRSTAGPSDP